ncbi:multidrug efflux RND transporter periplasmic adaptor subunit MexJ, partial [Pseudomonas aeruginosa]|nr:multidrug efflux RND transporter periplasmic adaptor subunit MexJ [Pseudomonas aeruginosa]
MYRHIPLVALSLLSSLFLAACGNGTPPPAAARPAIVVQPQPAGEVSQAFPGEIRARHEPELAFRIGGKVIRRLVEVGERVKKDQPLAELDPQDVRLQLEAARVQVSAAEANLQTVRAEYRRYRTLLDRNLVSHSQFENIQNSYRAGEARLKQIRAEFNVADNQAGYAVLRSPQDGVIASRRVEVGQVVAAGQTVFSLAADGEREVLIGLPEHSFERFRIGQPVSVELWSQRDRRFAGH